MDYGKLVSTAPHPVDKAIDSAKAVASYPPGAWWGR